MAPSWRAVEDALVFLDGMPDDIPLPSPEVGSDGEVGVYWDERDARIFAEVAFEGDGTYTYFAVSGTPDDVDQECGEEALPVGKAWPTDLLEILRLRTTT